MNDTVRRSAGAMVEVDARRARSHALLLRLGIFALAASLFGCDHATKIAAKVALAGGRAVPIYDGIVELRFAANDDTAFSALRYLGVPRPPGALLALSAAATLGVAIAWTVAARRRAAPRLTVIEHAAFACVVAGAFGNVVDRAMRGYVVDFIHVARWPVFNVADIAVCVGAALFFVARLGRRRPPAPPPDQARARDDA